MWRVAAINNGDIQVVTIDRSIAGVLLYKMVFFPPDETLQDIVAQLRAPHLARLFWTNAEAAATPRILRRQRNATVCIALNAPRDEIMKGISKNGRYDIRQAEKLAGQIRITRNEPEFAAHFLPLYNNFARSKPEVSPISDKILKRYQAHADYFLAYFDGQPMCGHVLFRDRAIGRARLLYSANRHLEHRETARICGILNRFLHWSEIGVYRDEGYKTYDFGGIQKDSRDGITRFKMSFGGKVIGEYTYWCAGSPRLGRSVLWLRNRRSPQ